MDAPKDPVINIERFVDVPGRGLVRVDETPPPDPVPELPVDLAELVHALRRGQVGKTRRMLDELDAAGSNASQLLAYRVFHHMLSGEVSEAHLLLKGIGSSTDDLWQKTALAAVQLITGMPDESAVLLDEILRDEPKHEIGRYLAALWRAQRGEIQDAYDLLAGLCRDYPDHALARLQLGQILMAAGDVARAGTLYEAAIDEAPNLLQAWERFASLLVVGGQPQEALSVAQRGLRHHPASVQLLEVVARTALATGAADLALDATRLLLLHSGDDPVAHANHAVALTAAGRHDEAAQLLKAAIDEFSHDSSLKQLLEEIQLMQRNAS